MIVLAVAALDSGKVVKGGAAVRGMFFCTVPTVSFAFAHLCSVSVAIALVALGKGADLNEELKVIELLAMKGDVCGHLPNVYRHLVACTRD